MGSTTSRLHDRVVKVDRVIDELELAECLLEEINAHPQQYPLESFYDPIEQYATYKRILEQLKEEQDLVQTWYAKIKSFQLNLNHSKEELSKYIERITPMAEAFQTGRLMPATVERAIPQDASKDMIASIQQEWKDNAKRHADHIRQWEEEQTAKRQKVTNESNTPSNL